MKYRLEILRKSFVVFPTNNSYCQSVRLTQSRKRICGNSEILFHLPIKENVSSK